MVGDLTVMVDGRTFILSIDVLENSTMPLFISLGDLGRLGVIVDTPECCLRVDGKRLHRKRCKAGHLLLDLCDKGDRNRCVRRAQGLVASEDTTEVMNRVGRHLAGLHRKGKVPPFKWTREESQDQSLGWRGAARDLFLLHRKRWSCGAGDVWLFPGAGNQEIYHHPEADAHVSSKILVTHKDGACEWLEGGKNCCTGQRFFRPPSQKTSRDQDRFSGPFSLPGSGVENKNENNL